MINGIRQVRETNDACDTTATVLSSGAKLKIVVVDVVVSSVVVVTPVNDDDDDALSSTVVVTIVDDDDVVVIAEPSPIVDEVVDVTITDIGVDGNGVGNGVG
jgi:hypothetical protein